MTFRESLRDIEACLRGSPHLYAMGIRGNVTRTNLAYANEHRNWRLYEALAQVLIAKARRLYAQDAIGLNVDEMVYALDASTIDLCLSLFFVGNISPHQGGHQTAYDDGLAWLHPYIHQYYRRKRA